MFGKHFALNEQTLPIVEEIGRHMPGGFFIYQADGDERLLYANAAVFHIFGCRDLAEFKALTGYTFKGMLHPEDYAEARKAIDAQIIAREDHLDHVEFRIIRKDGAVRWVDDYGHFTETEAYGGIYYVFISDITEQREQMASDMAVRQAVIEALSEAYHTVWLINDVETESFSLYRGDLAGRTDHTAPIRDALNRMKYSAAKEYYINTMVAASDRNRLQEELALSNIVRRLQDKSNFNINYLRTMPDGSERYFQIEFARVNMPGGRMGVVCGFKDVDDDVREGQRVQKMITAMASDYRCVYYVTLDTDEGICYRTDHKYENMIGLGEHFTFSKTFADYANSYVAEPYREGFLKFIEPENIRAGLSRELMITYRYLMIRNGVEKYEMLRMAGVRRPEDRDDHVVHAVGVGFTDIDLEMRESMARNQALSDALHAAEEANRAKTAFLSNMSHEIRTPMNAIIGLDRIALDNPDISEETRSHLEKIGESAGHLLGIINDVLDMTRIESGKMTLHNEEFSFSDTLEQVNIIIGGQCRDKGLTYDCRVRGPVDDYYIGDDMKLRQVMINILGNAVKFTPPGGSVVLEIEETARFEGKSTLRFTISDTGIGMSKAFLPRLFDAFSQEDASTTTRYGSTGLGMTITKNIVELMNGHITVESEKGKGTTFIVAVTLTQSRRSAADAEGARDFPDKKEAGHQETADTLKGCRILLAEDVEINAQIIMMLLSMQEIEVDIAGNGQIAVDSFARHAPGYYDAVLMDIRMPVMDGLEATRTIRQMARADAGRIPIIALTANAFDEDVQRSMQAGLNAHLSKPVDPDILFDTLRKLIRK